MSPGPGKARSPVKPRTKGGEEMKIATGIKAGADRENMAEPDDP